MRKPPLHIVLVTALAAGLPAMAADHPLDPLSHQEVWRTLGTARLYSDTQSLPQRERIT